MNNVVITGRIATQPKMMKTKKDVDYVKFRMAVNRGKDLPADFFWVTIFGEYGKALYDYLSRGRETLIQGQLRSSQYEKDGIKKESVEIVANHVELYREPRNSQKLQEEDQELLQDKEALEEPFEDDPFDDYPDLMDDFDMQETLGI